MDTPQVLIYKWAMGGSWERMILCFVLAASAGAAQSTGSARPGMLVPAEWLSEHLADPSLVLFHVGSAADYAGGHIPGARLLTLADISVTGERGLRLELPPVSALVEAFGKAGVSEASRIVVYAGTESVQSATRAWFTLDYLGLGGRASLLDGGLSLWRAQGRPLSIETPAIVPSTFAPHPRPELVVDAEWVRPHLADAGVVVLDARAPEFYSGAEAGRMPRAGRIPGARNIPFTSVYDPQRKLLPAETLREMLDARGAAPPKLVVSYCHIGLQASVLYFVSRYLGLDVRLYDGSYQDWSSRPELPVESGVRP